MPADLPLAVTMGDPAGIGGEIALKAWRDRRADLPCFFMLDDARRLHRLARRTGLDCPVETIGSAAEAGGVFGDALPVLQLSGEVNCEPGGDSTSCGALTIEAIDRAVDEVMAGRAAGMVTNPVTKSRLYAAGFRSPGHTEYLGERAGLDGPPVMLLAGPRLKVVPVTVHLALSQAIEALTTEAIVHALRTTWQAMREDFGIADPRIAVAGLNPHAGEGGHLGREEVEVIAPAIASLRAEGARISGPLASDSMFHEGARDSYDVAVCMYHDQALIPLKTLDFDEGVNITLGLPFVRTSPDHGTAYDIAGTGTANPSSLVAAIRAAAEIAGCRRQLSRPRAAAGAATRCPSAAS